MKNTIKVFGIIAIVAIIGFSFAACDDGNGNGDGDGEGEGPQLVPATGEYAQPLTGTLSNGNTTLTFTNWRGEVMTFTKSGGSLNGVWYTADKYERLTISGTKRWILADNYPVANTNGTGGTGGTGGNNGPGGEIPVGTGRYEDYAKGTLTVNDTNITFITTHIVPAAAPPEAPLPGPPAPPVNGNGAKWVTVDSPFTGIIIACVYKIVYGNGMFIASGNGDVAFKDALSTSPDGITWSARKDNPFSDDTNGIIAFGYGNGTFVVSEGTYYKPRIAYSSDGATWTVIGNPFKEDGYLSPIAYGNGMFVTKTSYDHKLAYSSDGAAWTVVPDSERLTSFIVENTIVEYGFFNGIAWGNDKFVANAIVGKVNVDLQIATSPDGITWTAETPVGLYISGPIVFGNGKFVIWGDYGRMAYSSDGITWTEISVFDNPFYSGSSSGATPNTMAYGNGKFVAGGDGGKIMYSYDGAAWTAETEMPFGTNSVRTIAYGNGRFVAGSSEGEIAYLLW